MALFDTIYDDYHQYKMVNFFNSDAFCWAAYNHKLKVLCRGVTGKRGRGIPPSVIQEDLKSKKGKLESPRTTKVDVMKGNPKCQNLVASIVYDTKPVRYLSMVLSDLKWVLIEKYVLNVDAGRIETLCFLRINKIHNYK